jgi:predicted restriction endonuclease
MAKRWTEHELLIAMNVYCRLPFGKLVKENALIIEVAAKMGRTPSSVSMKLCNLASFDPMHQARGVKGLSGASKADRAMWDSFSADWNRMSELSEAALEELINEEADLGNRVPGTPPRGESEVERHVKTRRHQRFFRNAVLASYDFKCGLTGIANPEMLVASHIIPWKDNEERRADPTNGLCLNALHDKAFDRYFITFDEDFRLVVSRDLLNQNVSEFQNESFGKLEGVRLVLPNRFAPDPRAMAAHRSLFKN